MEMKIVACLGNPGRKYAQNRHNVGARVGKLLAKAYALSINRKGFSSQWGKGIIENIETVLLFPQTYMNNSGRAVQSALTHFHLDSEHLIVIHDEIELPFGDFRVKFSGGHKGHNGLRSIIQHLNTADFYRIRIGIGRPLSDTPVADYVLSNFSKVEVNFLSTIYPEIEKKIISILHGLS